MATIYSGAGGSVKMTPGNLPRSVAKIVNAVVKGAQKGGKKSLNDIRKMIQDGVKNNTLGLNPLKDATIAARKAGKDAGITPGRPRKFGDAPLNYTGQTLKGIQVFINSDSMSLGFDEAATISYTNSNMKNVAAYHEYGFTIRGTYTKKMLAYLHVLFRKQFGEKEHARKRFVQGRSDLSTRGRAHVGVSYSRKVEPRPAWARATEKAFPIVELNFRTAILKAIEQTGLVIEET